MMEAPERIWLDWPGANKGEPVFDEPPENPWQAAQTRYILDTPEALAKSDTVRAMVAEAEARGMERAAVIADRHLSKVEINEPLWHEGQDWAAESIALAIRAEVPK